MDFSFSSLEFIYNMGKHRHFMNKKERGKKVKKLKKVMKTV